MSYVQNTEEKPSEDSFREENAESESAPDAQSPKAPSDSPAPDPRNRVDTQHTPSAGSQGAESRTSPYQLMIRGPSTPRTRTTVARTIL